MRGGRDWNKANKIGSLFSFSLGANGGEKNKGEEFDETGGKRRTKFWHRYAEVGDGREKRLHKKKQHTGV